MRSTELRIAGLKRKPTRSDVPRFTLLDGLNLSDPSVGGVTSSPTRTGKGGDALPSLSFSTCLDSATGTLWGMVETLRV